MTGKDETNESPANILCKSCGLCCTGHLFSRTKLRSAELDSARGLGLNVFGSHPSQRAFSQPCPLWQGQCTIYTSPDYPRSCRTYKCKLLKQVLDETTPLPEALAAVAEAKGMIRELEALLPGSENPNFRERLVALLEHSIPSDGQPDKDVDPQRQQVDTLLVFYDEIFGVTDLVDQLDEE